MLRWRSPISRRVRSICPTISPPASSASSRTGQTAPRARSSHRPAPPPASRRLRAAPSGPGPDRAASPSASRPDPEERELEPRRHGPRAPPPPPARRRARRRETSAIGPTSRAARAASAPIARCRPAASTSTCTRTASRSVRRREGAALRARRRARRRGSAAERAGRRQVCRRPRPGAAPASPLARHALPAFRSLARTGCRPDVNTRESSADRVNNSLHAGKRALSGPRCARRRRRGRRRGSG